MNVEIFALCDAATDYGGKLNLLGAFDTLNAAAIPVTHPSCTIAARVRFTQAEAGNHTLRISMIDEDGHHIAPRLDGNLNVQLNGDAESAAMNLIINFQRLEIKRAGEHRVDLELGGKLLSSLPFYVRVQQKP